VVQAGQAGGAKTPLPQLGQPGARDDPNLKGLSGARTKWYLRYLQQGKSPVEALSLAKTPQPLEQRPNSASKRANSTLTPPTETPKRQKVENSRPLTAPFDGPSTSRAAKATDVRKPSYAALTGAIKVAVVPEDYPKAVLSSENLSQLKDTLLEEIVLSGWDSPIKYGGIHFWVGQLIVDCRNATSAEWLQLAVPSLSKWRGVSLEVKMLGMELDLLSKEETIPADGDLGISRSATPTMEPII